MKKTPIDVLQEQINYYTKFRHKLFIRDGIVCESQEKLDNLICETDIKIAEFKDAIKILNVVKNSEAGAEEND